MSPFGLGWLVCWFYFVIPMLEHDKDKPKSKQYDLFDCFFWSLLYAVLALLWPVALAIWLNYVANPKTIHQQKESQPK